MLFGTGVRAASAARKNDKYLKISEPGVYRVRLLGEYHAFLFHWNPDGRKICAKTLEIRNPDYTAEDGSIRRGDYIYKQRDAAGNLVDYTSEQTYCYKCESDESRKRFVINVLEQNENDQLKAAGSPPNVRVMEFPYAVYKWLEDFYNQTGYYPSDPTYGPVFTIEVKYPRKPAGQKPEPREIIYEASWSDPGTAPISQQEYEMLFNGGGTNKPLVYNLVDEYNPLINKNSVLNPEAPAASGGNTAGGFGGNAGGFRTGSAAPAPNVVIPQQQPAYQPQAPVAPAQPAFQPQAPAQVVQQQPIYQPQQAPQASMQAEPAAGAYVSQPTAPITPVYEPQQAAAPQAAAPMANTAVPSVDDMLASLQQVVK